MFKKNTSEYLLLLAVIAWYVLHFAFFHGGYFGFDDVEYAKMAAHWKQNDPIHNSLYSYRYAAIFSVYLSYRWFGISDFAHFFAGLLVFVPIVWLVLRSLRARPLFERGAAALLLAALPMHNLYVEKPMPDLAVELGFLISFLSYAQLRFSAKPLPLLAFAWAFGVVLLFLAKETFLVFYPYFLGLFFFDLYKRQYLDFWKTAILLLLGFVSLYLFWNFWQFGDPLARVWAIFAGQYISPCSYDLLPLQATFERIGYGLWQALLRTFFLLPVPFALIFWKSEDARLRFVSKSFIALLLLANFMSISYTSYVPLCPDGRHSMYILPLAAMLWGRGVGALSEFRGRQIIFVALSLAAMLALSVFWQQEQTWWFYVPLVAAVFFGSNFLKFSSKYVLNLKKIGVMLLLFLAFGGVLWRHAQYNRSVDYVAQKQLNDFVLNKIEGKKYVVTDKVNSNIGLMQSAFDTTETQFIDFATRDTTALDPRVPQYLVANGLTIYLSGMAWEQFPNYLKTADDSLRLVFQNDKGKVFELNRN